MTAADMALLYLCVGLALFFNDLFWAPGSELLSLWRQLTGADDPDLGPVALAVTAVLGVGWAMLLWALLWPVKVWARLRDRSRW